MTVQDEFPSLLATREDRATFVRKATISTLGHLYALGKISAGFPSLHLCASAPLR